ncbi:leucine-rich repeat flightless-interacting protein 2 [Nematostella vectensis]|uniref:leucine-rich repeat flightless-interacting protein 2 n=1 Tax=Nematostella vectensis TaxID=45351 RepID=UPI00138FF484|nr:leucine-rich repeat flightless-interacting protein 2 [Nematostella vectensis]
MASHAARRGRLARTASSASEDQALNQIACEAEARLASKRAARAEARTIRMKELERQQKEAEDELDKQFQVDDSSGKKKVPIGRSISSGASPSIPKDDQKCPEANGPMVPEKALRSVQESLHDLEEKYRKNMVSIAQLDNEKQALLYQVDCLKDRLSEEEEISCEVKVELKDKTREAEKYQRQIKDNESEIQRLKDAIEYRDNWLAERGLNLYEDNSESNKDEINVFESLREGSTIDESGSEKSSFSESRSRSDSQRSSSMQPSVTDDREVLVAQIKKLQEEVSSLRREDFEMPKTITADLEELRREFSRQINDFRIKLQKAEQENARQEGVIMRLESQVKRYKTQAETAESTEDTLKSEKRKLQRELRKAQDEVNELQTVNDHMTKRFEKLKNKRKDEL